MKYSNNYYLMRCRVILIRIQVYCLGFFEKFPKRTPEQCELVNNVNFAEMFVSNGGKFKLIRMIIILCRNISLECCHAKKRVFFLALRQ